MGEQSRRGTAEFRVFAKGSLNMSVAPMDIGTFNSVWSLGFQETTAARLEGQPDHPGPAPERGPGHTLQGPRFR